MRVILLANQPPFDRYLFTFHWHSPHCFSVRCVSFSIFWKLISNQNEIKSFSFIYHNYVNHTRYAAVVTERDWVTLWSRVGMTSSLQRPWQRRCRHRTGWRPPSLRRRNSVSAMLTTDGWQLANKLPVFTILTLYSPVVTIWTAKFNMQQFYVPPTQCIYMFCVDLRTNSNYFPIQH